MIRSIRLTEKRQEAARNRKGGFGKGDTKRVTCPVCKASWEGVSFLDFRVVN